MHPRRIERTLDLLRVLRDEKGDVRAQGEGVNVEVHGQPVAGWLVKLSLTHGHLVLVGSGGGVRVELTKEGLEYMERLEQGAFLIENRFGIAI